MRYRPPVPAPDVVPPGDRRWLGLGLAAGPVAFVSAWAIGGARTPGYSPVHDAISRLAAIGAPSRPLMTAGFVAYGAAVLVGSATLRRSFLARAVPAVVVNGLATWAVAALPLDRSDGGDVAHGVAATVGYVSLAAVPALAAGPLARQGHRWAARVSVAAAVAIGACLVLTTVADAKGLAQRTGLGLGDVWLIVAGVALAAGTLEPAASTTPVDGTVDSGSERP